MPNEVLGLSKNALLGVILCGGASTRMGADKASTMLSDAMLWNHVAQRLEDQVGQIIISAAQSQDPTIFAPLPCLIDSELNPGPLPAIAQLLQEPNWQAYEWWVFTPCDTPLIPRDWVQQLVKQAGLTPGIYFVRYAGQDHYLHALWHRQMLATLVAFIHSGGAAVGAFYRLVGAHGIDYCAASSTATDPFFNINTPQQLALIHD
jgi:molybdopterin-guanine dinucleotide biosynthesis protein A